MIFISRYIRCFLFGILLVSVLIPVLDEITQLILTCLEWVKGMIMVPITKLNCKIQKLTNDNENSQSNPIGFSAACITEDEDDTDEDL